MKIQVFPLMGALALSTAIPIHQAAANPYSQTPYTTVSCGGEGLAPCHIGSDFMLNMYFPDPGFIASGVTCDKGLKVSGNTCEKSYNVHANLFNNPNSWLGFAMQEQMHSIGAHQHANWVNYLGSHNSYSTYFDNSVSTLAADQALSITDQLQEGMRIIRLDPRFYQGQIRLCHNTAYGILDESNNYTNCATGEKNFPQFTSADNILDKIFSPFGIHFSVADLIGKLGIAERSSQGRLYALGVHEVAEWLKKHPGEFILMRILGTSQLDSAHYHWIDDAINSELGNAVYLPPTDGSTVNQWPTLRELRGSGKQVIVFSDTGTEATWDWSTYVINDGYSDSSGYNYPACQNKDGFPLAMRQANQWSYVGEDRSGSNFFSDKPNGTLDNSSVANAAVCGYSMINLDFLLAGSRASQEEISIKPCVVSIDGCDVNVPLWNYKFADPDTRRESFIWSWGFNEMGSDGPAAMNLAFDINSLTPTWLLAPGQKVYNQGRWLSQAASHQHAFACAGPGAPLASFPSYQHPASYSWHITTTRAAWSQGEATCQNEFGADFHFWAPASGQENQNLYNYVRSTRLQQAGPNGSNFDFDPIWLNHIAGQITAAAPNVMKLTAQESVNINVLGGKGGRLEAQVTGSHLKVTVSGSQLGLQGLTGPIPGDFDESVKVYERDPASGALLLGLNIPVKIKVPSVTLHLKSDIPGGNASVQAHVVVDGKDYALPADVILQPNSNHEISAVPLLDLTPGSHLKFNAWMDGGQPNKAIHVGVNDVTLTGRFTLEYLVSVKRVPENGGSVSGGGWYDYSTKAVLQASPASAYQFQQYQGDFGKSIQNPYSVYNINKPETIEADFWLTGDFTNDGKVDTQDLAVLQAVLNSKPSGPTDNRDLNHDGRLNALDMRVLVTKCTHPHCAP